jgi:hypothetical protein
MFAFEYEYIREFETEFVNILECESGAHVGSIHEKNRGKKISCNCPFKKSSAWSQSITVFNDAKKMFKIQYENLAQVYL